MSVFAQSLLSYMCLTKWSIEGDSISMRSLSHDWGAEQLFPEITAPHWPSGQQAPSDVLSDRWPHLIGGLWRCIRWHMAISQVSSPRSWQEREKDQMAKWPACRWKEENLLSPQSSSFITSHLKYLSDTTPESRKCVLPLRKNTSESTVLKLFKWGS